MKIESRRAMSSNAQEVWEVMRDFGAIYQYHPQVVESATTNDIAEGLGAERYCVFTDGNRIQERIVDTSEMGYEVDIYELGSFPLKKAVASLSVEPSPDGGSMAYFGMDFVPKLGPLGWLMGHLIMKRKFTELLDAILEGLEQRVVTGEPV